MSTRHMYGTLKFVITVSGKNKLMQDLNFVIIESLIIWSSIYLKNLGHIKMTQAYPMWNVMGSLMLVSYIIVMGLGKKGHYSMHIFIT